MTLRLPSDYVASCRAEDRQWHRANDARLAAMTGEALRAMIRRLERELDGTPHLIARPS